MNIHFKSQAQSTSAKATPRRHVVLLALITFSAVRLTKAEPSGKDYEGRPFVTQAAPVLRFERRRAPHLRGIDYAFAPQTARGAALFSRFPPFTLTDRRIYVSGPWYNDPAVKLMFSRGITAIEAMPNFRQGPTDVRQLPRSQKAQLMGDSLFWETAGRLADELAAANPQDARIAPLRVFATEHKFVLNEAAFRELGHRVWLGERAPTDAKLQGVMYPMIDIELTGNSEHQRACMGWLYQGMAAAAAENGLKIVPITYGQWTYAVGAFWESMRQGGTGDPEYLLPEKDFLAASDPTLQACNDNNGVISMDGYMQAIWGQEPFYKRGADGALLFADGHPIFNDITKTQEYGQEFTLEKGEAEHCLADIYRQAVRMYLMYHRYAGAYPANSTMRKPFLKNTRIGAWSRYTNEGLQDIQQNDRPLPGWLMEMLTGMYLFTADDIVLWSSDTNTPPGPLGADYTKAWKYNAHGVAEYVVKAAHRYSALEPLHQGAFQWCWFRLPVVNKNQSEGERYDQKPIVFGKIRTLNQQPWLELYAAWPGLDQQPADFKVWIDRGGKRSAAYTIQLANGRSYFYDAWQLPTGWKNLEGKDIWLRFKDLQGKTHTWRGDWRAPVDEAVATPANYNGPV